MRKIEKDILIDSYGSCSGFYGRLRVLRRFGGKAFGVCSRFFKKDRDDGSSGSGGNNGSRAGDGASSGRRDDGSPGGGNNGSPAGDGGSHGRRDGVSGAGDRSPCRGGTLGYAANPSGIVLPDRI